APVDAARALWRHGVDPAGLVSPLLAAAAGWYADPRAVALLVEMGAAGAVPGLTELAERDERVVCAGSYYDVVWLDDRFRSGLRAAVAVLRG
ncbi:hypothetical protein ABZS66_57795, partial [Dactylosporangium sp. NPDC005572]